MSDKNICNFCQRARFPEKSIQSTVGYRNDETLRSGFFWESALGDGRAFWIFSRIYGYGQLEQGPKTGPSRAEEP